MATITTSTSLSITLPGQIPATAPAAVLVGPYGCPYTISSRSVPRPPPSEALIRLAYSGVCHGDIYSRNGGGPAPTMPVRPLTGGHEGVGTIVAFGEQATSAKLEIPFGIGDIVGIAWRSFVCGTCKPCRLGQENHCQKQQVTGLNRDGTYQCM